MIRGKLPDGLEDQVVAAILNGDAQLKVKRELGVDVLTIRRIIDRNNIANVFDSFRKQNRKAKNKTPKAIEDAVVKALQARETLHEITVKFGISKGTVNRIRKDANVIHKCQYCNATLLGVTKQFCNDRCGYRHRANLPNKCVHCGDKKIPIGRSRFCSNECKSANWHQRTAGNYNYPKPPKPKITRNCLKCGVEFTTAKISGPTAKVYCSSECRCAAALRARVNRSKPIEDQLKTCVVCGNEFSTLRNIGCWKANKDKQQARPHPGMKYCSEKCRSKKWTQYGVEKTREEVKDLSDNYIRGLLSHGTKGTRGIWSDELVQAKKADVRLKRTIRNIKKGK